MSYCSPVALLVFFSTLCEVAYASRLRKKTVDLAASGSNVSTISNVSIEALVDAAAEKVMRSVKLPHWSFLRKSSNSSNSSFFSSARYTMNGAVIFLHGEDQTAAEYRNSISGLVSLEQMLIENGFMPLFPDAELQKESTDEEFRSLWFVNDKGASGLSITEPDWSIRRAYGTIIGPAIDRMKTKYAVPVHKVLVGGFSRGGDMGLQMLRINPDLGGFFSVAGYLPDSSAVYPALKSAPKVQPVFMAHGSLDDVVPVAWGQTTHEKLKANGANVEFTEREVGHWQDQVILAKLQDWIVKTYEAIWAA